MIRINLIPPRVRRKEIEQRKQLAILAVVVLVSLGISYLMNSSVASGIQQEKLQISNEKKEVADWKIKLKKLDDYKKVKAEVQARLMAIETLRKQKRGPIRILDTLATTRPPQLWIESINEQNQILKVTGWAADNLVVSQFLANLQATSLFQAVELEGIAQEELKLGSGAGEKKYSLKKFSLQANIPLP